MHCKLWRFQKSILSKQMFSASLCGYTEYSKHTHLSEHSVGKLAYFLHMLGTNVQLAAADTQQCPIRQLLSVQLNLDEIIFSGMWVLDSHLQNKFWEMENEREEKTFIWRHYSITATGLLSYLFLTSYICASKHIPRTFTGKVLVKKKGWKAGIGPPGWEPFSWWGRDCCLVMVGLEPALAEGIGGQTGLFWVMLWLWVYSLWLLWCTSGETSMDKVPLVTWFGTMLFGSTMET